MSGRLASSVLIERIGGNCNERPCQRGVSVVDQRHESDPSIMSDNFTRREMDKHTRRPTRNRAADSKSSQPDSPARKSRTRRRPTGPLRPTLLLLLAALVASVWAQRSSSMAERAQDDPFLADDGQSSGPQAFQMPDYVIDDLADAEQPLVEPAPTDAELAGAAAWSAASGAGKRSLTRRQLQVFAADSGEPQQMAASGPYAVPFQTNAGDFEPAASYAMANFYLDQSTPSQQMRPTGGGHATKTQAASSSSSMSSNSNANKMQHQQTDEQAELEHEAKLLQQNQNKIGPHFVKEPPSFIHYLNSTDLIIPCAASGNPAPTIVSVLTDVSRVGRGRLLDVRGVARRRHHLLIHK
jgi:hypothetical protein